MATAANFILSGGDPRRIDRSDEPVVTQLLRAAHDPSASFEEYLYWASVTRLQEREANERYLERRGARTVWGSLKNQFSTRRVQNEVEEVIELEFESEEERSWGEKGDGSSGEGAASSDEMMRVTAEEWTMAGRAMRTAGWSSMFYLVTTDIFDPFSVP